MPKYNASLRIDAPQLDTTAQAATFGGYADQIDNPAPPALAEVEAPYGLTLATLLSRSAGTPTALVNATWTPPDGYDASTNAATLSYLLQWSTDSTFATNVNGAAALQPSAAIDGLATGTTYYFRVAAVFRTVQSLYSTSASILTAVDTTPPNPVTSVAWSWGASGDLDITWVDPTSANLKTIEVKIWSDAAKTVFYRALYAAPGAGRTVYTAAMNAADTSNAYDAAIYIEIKALSWGGIYSSVATPASNPTKAVPSTPSGLTSSWASDAGAAGADCVISWTNGADAIRYRLTIDGTARIVYGDRFTYTFDANRAEHSNVPDPVLTISLVALDGLNQSSTAATLTATNAAPATTSATLFGGFTTIGISITGSAAADIRDYTVRIIIGGVTSATYRTVNPNEVYSATVAGSYQVGIVVNDLFGQASSETVSSAVVIDALSIAELRAAASYTDDLGTAAATLDTLKDGTTASGGVTTASGVATSWHYYLASRAMLDRYQTFTISASAGVGYIGISADNTTYTWYSGPLLADGRTLTAVASEAAAQAAAIALPTSAGVMRWELPAMKEARYIKLGHKNTSAVAYTVYEFYPRRLIEGDDIRGESIKAINIAAGTITGDRLVATAIDAFTITGATIQTATSGARVVLSANTNGGLVGYGASDTYNVATGSGTYQILWKKSDGKFYFGGGAGVLSVNGITFSGLNTTATEVSWATSGVQGLSVNGAVGASDAYGYVVNGVGWSGNANKYGQVLIRATGRYIGGAGTTIWSGLYIGSGTDPGGQYDTGFYFTGYDAGGPSLTQFAYIKNGSVGTNGNIFAGGNFYPGNNTDCYYGRWGASTPYISGNVVIGGGLYPSNQGSYSITYSGAINGLGYAGTYTNGAFGAAGTIIAGPNEWFRTTGSSGWYNQTYAGGIYMQDSTWVRVYNSKQFLVNNYIQIDYGNPTLILNNNGGTGFRSNIRFLSGGGGKWQIGSDYNLSGSQSFYIYDEVAAAHRVVIGSSGGVQIAFGLYIGAIGIAPGYQIHLNNDSAGKPGSNTWIISSDRRLKNEHGPYTEGLATLRQLRPIRFSYNGKANMPNDGREYVGMLAQEVAEVAPAMISHIPGEIDGEQTDILQLDSHNLTYMLLNAVVELAGRIEALEQRPRRKRKAA